MYEGVNASDGIGIGVARVAVEPDLSFTPHAPEDAGDEKQRYAAAVAKFIEQTNAQIARMTETVGAAGEIIKEYDFSPVSIFWITASVLSFLIPVIFWKKLKAKGDEDLS